MSQWTWRHLTSPASWLFAQPFVQAYIKENINRESAALLAFVREIHCDFPSQRASNRENVSIWWCQQVTEIQKVYYCKTSSISRTKSQSLNVSCILLQVSLLNPLKPGVKLIMKMYLEQRRQAMLQLHLSYQLFYCLLRCDLYERFYGRRKNDEFMRAKRDINPL